jgi:hypothetical protein
LRSWPSQPARAGRAAGAMHAPARCQHRSDLNAHPRCCSPCAGTATASSTCNAKPAAPPQPQSQAGAAPFSPRAACRCCCMLCRWDTYVGFRRVGYSRLISFLAAPVIHSSFSYASAPSWVRAPGCQPRPR